MIIGGVMEHIELDEFKRSCLVAAIQGYAAKGESPDRATKQAIELVRCLSRELIHSGNSISIEALSKIEQLEQRINKKLDSDKKYHVSQALDDGMSIDELLVKNPHLYE